MKNLTMLAIVAGLLAGCSGSTFDASDDSAAMWSRVGTTTSKSRTRGEISDTARRQRELASQHRRPDTGGGSSD